MATSYFFTNPQSIQSEQTNEMAFGPQSDISGFERYNLENKFSLSTDSPAYAIVKSMILVVQDSSNANAVNIALAPVNVTTAGLPIRLMIYRGIKKSSLINSSGNIPLSDSSWGENNILDLVKNLQNKINSEAGSSNTANSDSLGYHFSTTDESVNVESIIFNNTDDFHPLIVEAGCQIGKFIGGATVGGIQLVMDQIGYEISLGTLKNTSHQLQVPKLITDPSWTEKQRLTELFKNRFLKEEILNYLDITALYGTLRNLGVQVTGQQFDDNFLLNFYNRNKVYVDIRDDRGFSFNHFFKLTDELKLGFYSESSELPEYVLQDYYTSWPLLILSDYQYTTSISEFFIELPASGGNSLSIISSFAGKIKTLNNNTKFKHLKISGEYEDTLIDPLRLQSWNYSDNSLGANYFLLKYCVTNTINNDNALPYVWQNFFSLKLNNIFGFENIQEGEFLVNTYSTINSPAVIDSARGEIYYPKTGIAVDTKNVTFFTYREEIIEGKSEYNPDYFLPIIGKGKFFGSFEANDYDYELGNEKVGFLNQLSKLESLNNFKLQKFSIEDPQNTGNTFQAVRYIRDMERRQSDEVFLTLQTITFTHDEYTVLKNAQTSLSSDLHGHPLYLSSKEFNLTEFDKFSLHDITLTLSKPFIDDPTEGGTSYVDMQNVLTDIVIDGQPITLSNIETE